MKCPQCGYPRISYVDSRRKLWKGQAGDAYRQERASEPRKNFQTNPCPKCGWKGKIEPERLVKNEVQESQTS